MKDHFFMALLGLFLFSINYWLVYVAEQDITSGLISVLYSGMVFMNIFNGFIFMKSKIEPRMMIGGLVGISGIVLIFFPEVNAFSFTEGELWGLVLGIISVYIASIGNIISARNTENGIPVIVSNTFGMAYGALIMLLLSLFSGCDYVIPLNFSYLASLFYLAIFGSVIAFGTYLTLVGKVGAAKASYAIMIVPIVALGFSTLFEGFEWTVEAIMGLLLVLLGNVFLVNKENRKKSSSKVLVD